MGVLAPEKISLEVGVLAEKEVLAPEIQQSGPRKNYLKVRILVPKKQKRKSWPQNFSNLAPFFIVSSVK